MKHHLTLFALITACALPPSPQSAQSPPSSPEPQSPGAPATTPNTATIFFAVVEGLYGEGVANDDVDILLRRDPATKQFSYFVSGCPLCSPAIDALQLYRGRPKFFGLKAEPDTFGAGLPAGESLALRSGDDAARLRVLNDFMERSMQRKLASLRLTAAEGRQWRLALQEMRDKGGALLKIAQERGEAGALGSAKGCAVCDGMHEAGSWMGR